MTTGLRMDAQTLQGEVQRAAHKRPWFATLALRWTGVVTCIVQGSRGISCWCCSRQFPHLCTHFQLTQISSHKSSRQEVVPLVNFGADSRAADYFACQPNR